MKRFFALSLSAVFMAGVLFPISSTGKGKSPFFQEIKRLFHASSGEGYTKKVEPNSSAVLRGDGGSQLFQAIRDSFHYGDQK